MIDYSADNLEELFWFEVSSIVRETFWFCPGFRKIPLRMSENSGGISMDCQDSYIISFKS